MELSETDQQGVTVLRVGADRIDAASAGAFRESLLSLVRRGVTRFVIDLSGVEFIDSTGLGALVAVLKVSGRGSMVVAGAQDSVVTLFKLTRMDKVFRMFPSSGEAAAALATDAQ
jgi:anti-sigma B factor antagonist